MNPDFRLYFLTMCNAKLNCDFYMKLNIINFELTEKGFQD